jgi:hypothetical protein
MLTKAQIVATITRSIQIKEEIERTVNESRNIVSQSHELVARSIQTATRSKLLVHGTAPAIRNRPKILANVRLR